MTQHMKYKALIILALLVCALMTYLLLNPSQNIINLTYTIDAFDVEKNEIIIEGVRNGDIFINDEGIAVDQCGDAIFEEDAR